MGEDKVFRQIIVLQAMDKLFSGKSDIAFMFKINNDITALLAGIRMGIKGNMEKRSRPLSLDLIREVGREGSEEAEYLAEYLILGTEALNEEQSAKEVQAMLLVALQEIHNRFRLTRL